MDLVSTKEKRDEYLRMKSRFYIAGWLDAERGEKQQVSENEQHALYYQDYLDGYRDSMTNQFALESI